MRYYLIKFIALFGFAVILFFSIAASPEPKFSWAVEPNETKLAISFPNQWQEWKISHHQKSMLEANEQNVLGKFDNNQLTINGVTTYFTKKEEEFWVKTEDNTGKMRDFKVEFTFGFEPLQQYLIKADNGKYQVLPISWDNRPVDRGGQRWFHIYGNDHIPYNDRLHWTQPLQNWNGMCADCHSTGLKQNYNSESNSFSSTSDTINVSCKSCHANDQFDDFKEKNGTIGWSFINEANTAEWLGPKRDQSEITICAACHSRRTPLTDGFTKSDNFLDSFSPTLIGIPEYFADGQVKEENYVWGSFLQSKMYSKGVICSDCHNPHSLKLKAQGNDLCTQCHNPEYFDVESHYNHEPNSTGAQCVNCHMPNSNFMQIDERRDHSIRIPRPDLNHKTNSPDACSSCHTDKTPTWAADQIDKWFGKKQSQKPHYGEVLNKVFKNEPGAEQQLKHLINDAEIPEIIRASAFAVLLNYPNEDTFTYIEKGLNADDPLIRLAAVRGSLSMPTEKRTPLILPRINDKFRAVRIEAIRVLSEVKWETIETEYKETYLKAKQEYITAQEQILWRGEGHYNLALFETNQGNHDKAKRHYLKAQSIDPYFSASYVNLADLFRAEGNEKNNINQIETGLSILPENPDLNFSKALYLARNQKPHEALIFMEKAVSHAPKNSYYAYIYAVALNDLGQKNDALNVLKKIIQYSPYDENINFMLLNVYRSDGNWKEALKYAENLARLFPENKMISRIKTDITSKIK